MIVFRWLMTCFLGLLLSCTGITLADTAVPNNDTSSQEATPIAQVMSRFEVAETLLTYFQIPPSWTLTDVSPFRDVPIDSKQYALLETAWQFHILTPKASWRLYPNEPMSQLDAWLAIQGLLFTQESVKDVYNLALLSEDKTFGTLPEATQRKLGVLYERYVFDVLKDLPLKPNTPPTRKFGPGKKSLRSCRRLTTVCLVRRDP